MPLALRVGTPVRGPTYPSAIAAFLRFHCVHCRAMNSFATNVTTCNTTASQESVPVVSAISSRSSTIEAQRRDCRCRPRAESERGREHARYEVRCAASARACRGTGQRSPPSSRSGTGSEPGSCLRAQWCDEMIRSVFDAISWKASQSGFGAQGHGVQDKRRRGLTENPTRFAIGTDRVGRLVVHPRQDGICTVDTKGKRHRT